MLNRTLTLFLETRSRIVVSNPCDSASVRGPDSPKLAASPHMLSSWPSRPTRIPATLAKHILEQAGCLKAFGLVRSLIKHLLAAHGARVPLLGSAAASFGRASGQCDIAEHAMECGGLGAKKRAGFRCATGAVFQFV